MKLALCLNINPVPASRPRFVRRGQFTATYYAGRYKEFLNESGPAALTAALAAYPRVKRKLPIHGPVMMDVEFRVKRPKTTKLVTPRGDVDNYGKGLLDLLQPDVIFDDKQVVDLRLKKVFAAGEPCIVIEIQTLDL